MDWMLLYEYVWIGVGVAVLCYLAYKAGRRLGGRKP